MKRQTLSLSVCALITAGILATPHLAPAQGVLSPGLPIIGIAATPGSTVSTLATVGTVAGANNYPAAESPNLAIDANTATKYLNFAEVNTGFIVTVPSAVTLNGLRFTTANDAPERDPFMVSLEGAFAADPNSALASTSWTSIYSGVSGLGTDPGRLANGQTINFANALSFNTYRLLITSVRDGAAANSMQFSEVQFFAVPEPTTFSLLGLGLAGWFLRRRK